MAKYFPLNLVNHDTGRLIEEIGRGRGSSHHGRVDFKGGGWDALTTIPALENDLDSATQPTWVVSWHPVHGLYAALHDSWDSAVHDVHEANLVSEIGHIQTSRSGGYVLIGGVWHRPDLTPVPGARTVFAHECLDEPGIAQWARTAVIAPSQAPVGLLAPELMPEMLVDYAELSQVVGVSASALRARNSRQRQSEQIRRSVPAPQVSRSGLGWSRAVIAREFGGVDMRYVVVAGGLNREPTYYRDLSLEDAQDAARGLRVLAEAHGVTTEAILGESWVSVDEDLEQFPGLVLWANVCPSPTSGGSCDWPELTPSDLVARVMSWRL